MKNSLLDTNSLMDGVTTSGIVSELTLKELDVLKLAHGVKGYKARRAINHLLENFENYTFEGIGLDNSQEVDNKLLQIAQEKKVTLLSNDKMVQLLGKVYGIPVESYEVPEVKIEASEGIRYIEEDELAEILSGTWQAQPNDVIGDYLVHNYTAPSGNKAYSISKIEQAPNGDIYAKYYHNRNRMRLEGEWATVKPRNAEQACLIDILNDESKKVVVATGSYGTGKSYLAMNYLLNAIDFSGRFGSNAKVPGVDIPQIVVIPNNSIVSDSRDVGILPGDLIDKELPYLGSFVDLLGEEYIAELVDRGIIKVVPLAHLRGRNFDNTLVYVQEAQNLTRSHVQLIVGRVGYNSRVLFDGDIKQADKNIFKRDNGLMLLNALRSESRDRGLIGTVRLQTIERSPVAQLAADLEDFEEELSRRK